MDADASLVKLEIDEFIDVEQLTCSDIDFDISETSLFSLLANEGNGNGDEADKAIPANFHQLLTNSNESYPTTSSIPTVSKPQVKPEEWVCKICKKSFRYLHMLNRHLPMHTAERLHQCKICGASFRQLSTLNQHHVTHSNARPHVCEICHKAFNRTSTLISHRKIHLEKKSHKCSYCGKAFHQKGNLITHIYTHTNARPYRCEICGYGFNQKSNLTCHRRSAHGESKFCCGKCGKTFCRRSDQIQHEKKTLCSQRKGVTLIQNNTDEKIKYVVLHHNGQTGKENAIAVSPTDLPPGYFCSSIIRGAQLINFADN